MQVAKRTAEGKWGTSKITARPNNLRLQGLGMTEDFYKVECGCSWEASSYSDVWWVAGHPRIIAAIQAALY